MLLTETDLPGYKLDFSADRFPFSITQDDVIGGSVPCQTFLNAKDSYVAAYGTLAEAARTFKGSNGKTAFGITIRTYPSEAKAKAVVADIAKGASGCKALQAERPGDPSPMRMTAIASIPVDQGMAAFVVAYPAVLWIEVTEQVGAHTVSTHAEFPPTIDDGQEKKAVDALLPHLLEEAAKLQSAAG